jgi:hypothetical protein
MSRTPTRARALLNFLAGGALSSPCLFVSLPAASTIENPPDSRIRSSRVYGLIRPLELVIALILIAGAAGKFYYLAFGQSINLSAAFFGIRFLFALAAIEFLVGFSFAFGVVNKSFVWLTGILFALFACYSFVLVMMGRSSCECLGEVPLHPAITLGVDIAAIGACISLLKTSRRPMDQRSSVLKPTIVTMGITFFLLLLYASHATFLGRKARAQMEGDDCAIVEAKSQDRSPIDHTWRRATITLQNISTEPITLNGFRRSCACRDIGGFPKIVSPGSTSKIDFDIRVPDRPGIFVTTVRIFVSSPGKPMAVVVTPIVGRNP